MTSLANQKNYLLGDDRNALRRYELFDALYQPGTSARFVSLALPKDLQVLEVGCGIGDTACFMARSVVPDGHVTAFDQSPELVELAQQRARDQAIGNVTFLCARAQDFDMPPDRYDFVHTRYVLSYAPNARDIVARLFRTVKSGGGFFGEEIHQSYVMHRQPRWFDDQTRWFARLIEKGGGSPNYGLDGLPGDLIDAGFCDLEVNAFWPVHDQDAIREMLRMALSNEMKGHLVDAGIATAEEVDRNAAQMAKPDPSGLISASMAVQIVATKP